MSKRVIDGLDGFRALVGETIGTSGLVEVTQQRIERFCESVDNDEWIHWDVERCKASPFGNTIAPSMFTLAYFSKLFFEMVEIENVPNMLFLGSDRVRLLAPLVCGEKFNITVKLERGRGEEERHQRVLRIDLECRRQRQSHRHRHFHYSLHG